MIAPLLATKLYIPSSRASVVPRQRLIDRVRQGVTGPLTLVAAPPGFGKTTLVSKSLADLPAPLAWLSLDDGDDDPVRFGAYFIAALQTLRPAFGDSVLAMLRSPQPPPLETVLAWLVNDIAASLPDFVFVLDDYHVISTPAIHAALALLLDHLPPGMHLVIASRADPPLPLARWRVRGQLTELRADDLRFTPEEAAAFLEEAGLRLDSADVAALETRTEGWAAGLQLAAIALQSASSGQGRNDPHSFVAAFAGDNRYVLDYLTEEVLQRQPPPVQTFLLQTSILERLSGALCAAVTGNADSQALLEKLERANLFLTPLDSQRRWYRYHRLFADLLRYRLQQGRPALAPELHHRASLWFQQNGYPAEAVPHALQAQRYELAAGLIEGQAEGLLLRGETATLAAWGKALPDTVLAAHPQLAIYQASAIAIGGDLEGSQRILDMAEAGLSHVPIPETANVQRLRGQAEALRSLLAVAHSDLPTAIALAKQALEHLPEGDMLWRHVASIGLANSYRATGNIVAASQMYARIAAEESPGNYYLALVAAFAFGASLEEQGHLRQAEAVFQGSLQRARRWSQGSQAASPAEGLALAGLAGLNYEWNDLQTARRQVETALELGERGRIADIMTNGYVTLAQLLLVEGETEATLEVLEKRLACVSPAYIAATNAFEAYVSLKQNRLSAAAEWLEAYQPPLHPLDGPSEYEASVRARVLSALARYDEALRLIEKILANAERIGRWRSVIQLRNLEALAWQAQGNEASALAALEQALRLAEPEGFVRTFVDEGEPMQRLLGQSLPRLRGSAPSLAHYIEKLLAAFAPPASGAQAPSVRPVPLSEGLLEPLSDREMEVLRLLAADRSNQEIAEALVVSVNTVKTHINRLYAKLGAHSRLEAVNRARELHLL